MDINPTCPSCHLQVLPVFYFCPNCGKNLRPKPLSISVGKQIGIYLLSFFLPPLGLVPGIRYLSQKSGKAKIVGMIAVALTIISVVLTIQIALSLMSQLQGMLNFQSNNQINSQLNNQLNNQLNKQMQNTQSQLDQIPF